MERRARGGTKRRETREDERRPDGKEARSNRGKPRNERNSGDGKEERTKEKKKEEQEENVTRNSVDFWLSPSLTVTLGEKKRREEWG